MQFTESEIDNLRYNKATLREDVIGNAQWLDAYRSGFQKILDKAAERIVADHALFAAVGTATSPFPLLDACIVLSVASSMTRNLSLVYNLRLNRLGTWMLLGKIVRTVFFSGIAGTISRGIAGALTQAAVSGQGEAVGDVSVAAVGAAIGTGDGMAAAQSLDNGAISSLASEMLGMVDDIMPGMAGKATAVAASGLKKVIPKASEGLVNYLFMRRLGKAACAMLKIVK